jgi:hypothetical protein
MEIAQGLGSNFKNAVESLARLTADHKTYVIPDIADIDALDEKPEALLQFRVQVRKACDFWHMRVAPADDCMAVSIVSGA